MSNIPTDPPSSNTTDITFVAGKKAYGKYPVRILQGERVLAAGSVNPHSPSQISSFLAEAVERFPSLPTDQIRQHLLQLAAERDGGGNESTYAATEDGLFLRRGNHDSLVQLTNFTARIITDIQRDDGLECKRFFELEVNMKGVLSRITLLVGQFMSMNWVGDHLGAGAMILAGATNRDHARAAIHETGKDAQHVRVFAHVGWAKFDAENIYVTAAGAIGAQGLVRNVRVDLNPQLHEFALLPKDKKNHLNSVKASLEFLDVAPDHVTFPAYAAIARAVLGGADCSIFICGPTGAFKSEIAALLQQHFGRAMNARRLPGSWSSTENSLEELCFAAKDAVLVIDDFAPRGSPIDQQRLHQRADRIFRAVGNHSARGRMGADLKLLPLHPPRGIVIGTGEDLPSGHSLRARMLAVDLRHGDVSQDKLTRLQTLAQNGWFAAATGAYVRWLAPRIVGIRAALPARVAQLRTAAQQHSMHARTPEMIASLTFGLETYFTFAAEVGAITEDQRKSLDDRAWSALLAAGQAQADNLRHLDPAESFISLIVAALASGRAHLASRDGQVPQTPTKYGWRLGNGDHRVWYPKGERIGWVDDDAIYLEPMLSYNLARQMGFLGDGVCVTTIVLRKRLSDRGFLLRDPNRHENLIRRTLEGANRRVLAVTHDAIFPPEAGSESAVVSQ